MSGGERMMGGKARGGLTGWHVLLMLIGFFGVVFGMNGIFLASAIRTYTGVVSVEPYVKGLHYNDRIAAGERQARLGWQETLSVMPNGSVTLSLADGAGRPVTGARIEGTIGRPSTNRLDRQVGLVETGPGTYVAQVGELADGTWLVSVQAKSREGGDDPVYRLRRRICLKC